MKTKIWIIVFSFLCFTACLFANHLGVFKLSNITDYQPPAFNKTHIDSMVKYAESNGYNQHLGILINLKKHSGSKRFFLVDLDNHKILLDGLCCHGGGKSGLKENATFSNTVGGNCSAEGFYKIGSKYNGKFGTAYKLHGLCVSNCNAFDRFVVLHGHDCVPDSPVPVPICQSEGCPTLSPEVLKKLEPYLDKSEKPVLLWIF